MSTIISKRNTVRGLIIALGLVIIGCTSHENALPIKPKRTATLEALYTSTPPNKVTSSYWSNVDYLVINPVNITTHQVPADDGLYNVSGSYNGLQDFNKGKDPRISLKAAYDDQNIYILVSWLDTTYNASSANWVYNGPTDPHKSGSTAGWTSQQSDDKMILSFDMGSSKRDVWSWSLALSEPLGYAMDMLDDGGLLTTDAGDKTYTRNSVGVSNTSGPQYQWNEAQQNIARTIGGPTVLDPGLYLLGDHKKTFYGDVAAGDIVFQNNCAECHGIIGDGNGVNPSGVAFNIPGKITRFTKAGFTSFASNQDVHEGAAHFIDLDTTQITNLFARLRSFSGIPGYYLQNPTGSNSDVHSLSNVPLGNIDGYNSKGYKVLLVRALNTGNADDVVFNPTVGQYQFNISFSDNDDLNRIGEINNTLTFKPK